MSRLKNNTNHKNNQLDWEEQQFLKIDNQFNVYPIDLNNPVVNNENPTKPMIWLAWSRLNINKPNLSTAISPSNPKPSNDIQKQAVRLLLSKLIHHYKADFVPYMCADLSSPIWLDESNYPYRLMPLEYFVSFSHSGDTVSCVISPTPIGIDIELSDVPLSVAKRFYHSEEIDWIETLDTRVQQRAIHLLWMLKEATIKRLCNQHLETYLIQGLKRNLTTPAKKLLLKSHNPTDSHEDSVVDSNIYYVSFKSKLKARLQLQSPIIHYIYFKSLNLIVCL